MQPLALILQATGTNRDNDVALALQLAGARTEIVPLNLLRTAQRRWSDYQMLVIPGGFSYADALGAGKLLALDLQAYFASETAEFVASGKPVIGICNGFQALVKSGILPAVDGRQNGPQATLTFNQGGHFECRWVTLQPVSQRCIWTRNLGEQPIYCPVAHGEGKFYAGSSTVLDSLAQADQIALVYSSSDGQPAGGVYPDNPNGSQRDIAGVCNPQGNVLGLMPHPENHVLPHQHPRWARGERFGSGLSLFECGVQHAALL